MRRGGPVPGHNLRPWESGEKERGSQRQGPASSEAAHFPSLHNQLLGPSHAGPFCGLTDSTLHPAYSSANLGHLDHPQGEHNALRSTHRPEFVAPIGSFQLESFSQAQQLSGKDGWDKVDGFSQDFELADGAYAHGPEARQRPSASQPSGGGLEAPIMRQGYGALDFARYHVGDGKTYPAGRNLQESHPGSIGESREGGGSAGRFRPERGETAEAVPFRLLHPGSGASSGRAVESSLPYGSVNWRGNDAQAQALQRLDSLDVWQYISPSPMVQQHGHRPADSQGPSKRQRTATVPDGDTAEIQWTEFRANLGTSGRDFQTRGNNSMRIEGLGPSGRPSRHAFRESSVAAASNQIPARYDRGKPVRFPGGPSSRPAVGGPSGRDGPRVAAAPFAGFQNNAAQELEDGRLLLGQSPVSASAQHPPTAEAMGDRAASGRSKRAEQERPDRVPEGEHSGPGNETDANEDGAVPISIDTGTGSSGLDPSGSGRGGSFAVGASGSTGFAFNGSIGRYSGSGMGSSGISEVDVNGMNVATAALGYGGNPAWGGHGGRVGPGAELGWIPRTSVANSMMPAPGAGAAPSSMGMSSMATRLRPSGRLAGVGGSGNPCTGFNLWGLAGASMPAARALALSGAGGASGGASDRKLANQWAYSWAGRKPARVMQPSEEGVVKGGERPVEQEGDRDRDSEQQGRQPCIVDQGAALVASPGGFLQRTSSLARGHKRENGAMDVFPSPSPEELHFAEISSQELDEAKKAMVEDARERSGKRSGSPARPAEVGEVCGPEDKGTQAENGYLHREGGGERRDSEGGDKVRGEVNLAGNEGQPGRRTAGGEDMKMERPAKEVGRDGRVPVEVSLEETSDPGEQEAEWVQQREDDCSTIHVQPSNEKEAQGLEAEKPQSIGALGRELEGERRVQTGLKAGSLGMGDGPVQDRPVEAADTIEGSQNKGVADREEERKKLPRVQERPGSQQEQKRTSVPSQEGVGSTEIEKAGAGSGGYGHSLDAQHGPCETASAEVKGEAGKINGQEQGKKEDSELKRKQRERRRQEKKRDERKREERQQAGEREVGGDRGREKSQDTGCHVSKDRGVGGRDQWSGSKDKKKKRMRSDGTSNGFVAVRHFPDAFAQEQSREPQDKETVPPAAPLAVSGRLGQEDPAKLALERESLTGYGSFRGWVRAVGRGKSPRTPALPRSIGYDGAAGGSLPAQRAQGPATPASAGGPTAPPGNASEAGQGAMEPPAVGRTEGRAQGGEGRELGEMLGTAMRESEGMPGTEREGPREGGAAVPLPPPSRRHLSRVRPEDVVVPAVQSGSGGTDENGLGGGSSDERGGGREREIQVVPSAPQPWPSEGLHEPGLLEPSPWGGGTRSAEEPHAILGRMGASRGWQEQPQAVGGAEAGGSALAASERRPAGGARRAGEGEEGGLEASQLEGPSELPPSTAEGPSGTSANPTATMTGTTATGTGTATGTVTGTGTVGGPELGTASTAGAGLGGLTNAQEGQLRDRWIGRFIGTAAKSMLRSGSREHLDPSPHQQSPQQGGLGQPQLSAKPQERTETAIPQCVPAFGSYLRYGTEQAAEEAEKGKPAGSAGPGRPFLPPQRAPPVRPEVGIAAQQQALRGHLGVPLVTAQASKQQDDGSGEEGPPGLGVAEYAAGVSALRSWRLESAKCREDVLKEYSAIEPRSAQVSLAGSAHLALSSRAPGGLGQPGRGHGPRCQYCGLWGHPVVLCTETRDCEVAAMLARIPHQAAGPSSSLEGPPSLCIWPGPRHPPEGEAGGAAREGVGEAGPSTGSVGGPGRTPGLPQGGAGDEKPLCLRCMERGHWGVDCSLSVSEASARARAREGPDGAGRAGFTYVGAGRYAYTGARTAQRHGAASGDVAAGGFLVGKPGWEEALVGSSSPRGGMEDVRGGSGSPREVGTGRAAGGGRRGPWKMSSWERRRLKELDGLEEERGRGKAQEDPPAGGEQEERERAGKRKREGRGHFEEVGGVGLQEAAWHEEGGLTSAETAGLLDAIESIRLPRRDLLRWAEARDLASRVKGFFLRLRFGRRQEDQGGTGYRMARITGASRKWIAGQSRMALVVDFGDGEYTVDGQYVSNKPFTEVELVEWWCGACHQGRPTVTKDEIEAKFQERQAWPP